MKRLGWLLILALVACGPAVVVTPTVTPTNISASIPSLTATPTQLATLEPDQAREKIRLAMQESVDCDAPCFWGIVPDQTSVSEAIDIFSHLGLQVKNTRLDNKVFYGVAYEIDNGFFFTVPLTTQEGIVKNIRVNISPEPYQAGVPRQWESFSPISLIRRYGVPSRVAMSIAFGPSLDSSNIDFNMTFYYDSRDLIVYYYGEHLGEKPQICPLTDQFDLVRIWMGKDPYNPPKNFSSMESVTSLTMEEFVKLMTGNPEQACFKLNLDAFK